jgi:hypothetical protein
MRGSVRFSDGVKTATSRWDMEKPSVKWCSTKESDRALAFFKPLKYCGEI